MADTPPPPPGFELDGPSAGAPPPPPAGFVVDGPPTAHTREAAARSGIATAPAAQPDDSTWGDVGKAITQAGAGFNEGIAPALNLPNEAANAGVNLVRRAFGAEPQEDPVAKHYADAFIAPAGAPQSPIQRVMRAGGDMAGQNLPLLIPGMGAAGTGIRSGVTMAEQAAPGVVPKVKGAIDAALQWMAEHPTKAALSDTTGAFESGAGGQVGRQVGENDGASPDQQRMDELIGQFATPAALAGWSRVSPTLAAPKVAAWGARKAIQMVPESVLPEGLQTAGTPASRAADQLAYSNREGPYADPNAPAPAEPNWAVRQMDAGANARTAKAADTVRDEMSQIQARPEAAANSSVAATLKKQIPGFAPGVAKETGDQALLNLQQRLESNATGDELRTAQDKYDASANALRDKFASLAPPVEAPKPAGMIGPMPADKTPQDTVMGAAGSNVAREQGLTGLEQDVAKNKLSTTAATLPDANRAPAGAKLRGIHDAGYEASNAKTTALRNAIDPKGAARVSTEPLNAALAPALKNLNTDLTSPLVPQKVRDLLGRTAEQPFEPDTGTVTHGASGVVSYPPNVGRSAPNTADVNSLLDARTAVLQDLRRLNSAAALSPEQMSQREVLNATLDHLNKFVDTAQFPDPGVQQRFEAFRSYYRDQHVPDFEEGASRDIGRYDRFGYDKNKVPDEKVLEQFGGPNNISAAKQFTRVHGDNPEAVQLMVDHQLGRLKAEALDPQTNALKEGSVQKFLTKNKELLDNLPPEVKAAVSAKDPDAVYAQLSQLEQRQRALADSNVAKLAGKTPEKAIDGALNDWQLMRDLKAKMGGNPQNEAALTRAVMNTAPDVMDAKAFNGWLEGHDRALRQVITPQHLQSLKDISKAASIQTQLPRPTGTAEMPQSALGKAGKAIGLPIKSVLQRFLAVAQGRVGKPYTAMDIGTRMFDSFTERETDAIWKEALFNPKVAETLSQVVRNKGATGLQLSRLHNYLLTVGSADAGQDYPHK